MRESRQVGELGLLSRVLRRFVGCVWGVEVAVCTPVDDTLWLLQWKPVVIQRLSNVIEECNFVRYELL